MAVPDKVEAVQKATETFSKQSNPVEEMERMAPNKEHFDTLMNSSQPVKPTSFERIDTKAFGTEEVQSIEKQPVFAEENVSAQKSGTATDQEQKRRQQQQTEEVEGVSATGSKKSVASKSSSLMDEVSKLNKNVSSISNLSPENIKAQANNVIAQLENVKTQLSQAQTEIKPSYQTLLRNRLSHIDDNLKIALNKAGVEYTPPPVSATGSANPLQRFLGFVTNSQHQLENLNGVIDQFNVTGEITPANMLAIQMKMSYVQQQIELFTSLLNKALESTKTIMNVQV
jgi:hypothetical protein